MDLRCVLSLFSCVWLCAILWTVACQPLLSMGFSRQENWSGSPYPPPGDLPDQGTEPRSPALQADSLLSEPLGKCCVDFCCTTKLFCYTHTYILFHVLFHYGLSQDLFFFKDFFWCGPFLKSFIDFITILFLFFCSLLFWSWGWGMWDLWSLIRDRTWGPDTERLSLNHWTTREVPLSQDTEYSYLCYTVGPCCLSTLYVGLGKSSFKNSTGSSFLA